jgi:hypothetical protein
MGFRNIIFIFLLLLNLVQTSFAQDNAKDMEELVAGTKSDLLIVISGGLAGAVLGLSTLSFVDEPKEHTRNIIVGASIGIIAGVGYVAYSQASKSREMMYGAPDQQAKYDPKAFNTYQRVSWHNEAVDKNSSFISSPNQIGFSFQY